MQNKLKHQVSLQPAQIDCTKEGSAYYKEVDPKIQPGDTKHKNTNSLVHFFIQLKNQNLVYKHEKYM